ncbi:MAG: nucleotide sugar dehydrogenase, partial [Alphaproteobacteria bacterium]|nr:nucleotide sugar dehydrogenase [Alphaproteobacteria bacterium]
INVAMPSYVIGKLSEALDDRFSKALNGAKILIIGMAYKKNIADIRESPAFAVMEQLKRRKAVAIFHDPYVDVIPLTREHKAFAGIKSTVLTPELVQAQDAVVIITPHDSIDYAMVAKCARLVVDTRNALFKIANRSNIVKA